MKNQIVAEALRHGESEIIEAQPATGKAVIYLRVSTTRQAQKNGEAEGYSIPAQRAACTRKVSDLGGEVVAEFVDAGESARSANRPELQRMLKYIAANPISYVIVHKIDRLARDRTDDVAILMAIKSAGAVLVSVSENIDDTPAGKLQHGIMASMAEYYSSNLSHEAKKGIAQKAKRGGTHGVAPIGYLNTVTRLEGRDIKGIAHDPERADHIRFAFRTYANGDVSISALTDLLKERGLTSRKTQRYEGKPLSNSQVHRMLSNPYYIGKIRHRGVIYDGAHEALIDDDAWYQVQRLLAGRRLAGDRAWKHDHHLKGMLVCGRCDGRMGYGHSKGRGGVYSYFFCLGRHTGRTNCDLPYVQIEHIEQAMQEEWDTHVQFSQCEIMRIGEEAHRLLAAETTEASKLSNAQKKRLQVLQIKKQRLIDAYLDGALDASDIRPRQEQVAAEIADAERLIRNADTDTEKVRSNIALVLKLMEKAGDLYRTVSDSVRRDLNQAVFACIRVDVPDEDPHAPTKTAEKLIALDAEFSPPVAVIAELGRTGASIQNRAHNARCGTTRRNTGQRAAGKAGASEIKTPDELSLIGGSNLTNLAETEGFEPSVPLRGLHLSRVVH